MLHKFRKNKFFKNFAYLFSSQVISQLISLLNAFFIPRLLGPSIYGEYQLVLNYILLYKAFTVPGVNKTNIRALSQNQDDIDPRISDTLKIRLVVSTIGIVLMLASLFIIDYSTNAKYGILFFCSYLLIFSAFDSLKSLFIVKQNFKVFSKIDIYKSIFQSGVSIIAVLISKSIFPLIAIYLITEIFGLLFLYKRAVKDFQLKVDFGRKLNFKLIKDSVYFSFIDFLNMLTSRIDIFVISILADPKSVGLYALANTIARKGLIIRRALAQPLFPVYAAKEKLTAATLNKHCLMLAIPSIPIVGIIILTSQYVIPGIAGEEYLESVPILNALAFFLLFHYLVLPYSTALESNYNEKLSLIIGIFRALSNLILNVVLFKVYGLIGIAYASVLVWALNFILFAIISNVKFKRKISVQPTM
ncbi:oligosaccharide flippase family protein [Flammeovirga agarivorans]|uniref:Oligosaccharide flippase family protein n=1 Tax=Flammeovirga agarivorans TaxID=2726742 RepID=A0A7X8SPJ4_9BACT|nr:oligosaccharide flippase family protein [Flammeovirga agarivorans]NLR93940.1 oligosaccharide flippase family protein [Flammeovirga agarivorans]